MIDDHPLVYHLIKIKTSNALLHISTGKIGSRRTKTEMEEPRLREIVKDYDKHNIDSF